MIYEKSQNWRRKVVLYSITDLRVWLQKQTCSGLSPTIPTKFWKRNLFDSFFNFSYMLGAESLSSYVGNYLSLNIAFIIHTFHLNYQKIKIPYSGFALKWMFVVQQKKAAYETIVLRVVFFWVISDQAVFSICLLFLSLHR